MQLNYWLGLNKLATERGGDDALIVRPDDESEADPEDIGWYSLGADTVEYVTDAERGKVFRSSGTGIFGAAYAIIGDDALNSNPNDTPLDSTNGVVSVWIMNDHTDPMSILMAGTDSTDDEYGIFIRTTTGTTGWTGNTYNIYLGNVMNDGEWYYLEYDVKAIIEAHSSLPSFKEVEGFGVWGKDVHVDDLIIGTGKLERAYHLIPGASIGGYLGAQAGVDFTWTDADSTEHSQWYYQYNDLGTVMTTTDSAGDSIGIYEPTFYGDYVIIDGERPDTLGLTSKFYDEDIELYYFNARWYDKDRGRWMSRDRLGYVDGMNLYQFSRSLPSDSIDPKGQYTSFPLRCGPPYKHLKASTVNIYQKTGTWYPEPMDGDEPTLYPTSCKCIYTLTARDVTYTSLRNCISIVWMDGDCGTGQFIITNTFEPGPMIVEREQIDSDSTIEKSGEVKTSSEGIGCDCGDQTIREATF